MTDQEKSIFRAMTPAQRIHAAMRLYDSARGLKEAALRSFHPDWPEEKIRDAVRECFRNART